MAIFLLMPEIFQKKYYQKFGDIFANAMQHLENFFSMGQSNLGLRWSNKFRCGLDFSERAGGFYPWCPWQLQGTDSQAAITAGWLGEGL